ncbi:MAG: DNA replication and repair protein RecF [Thermoanaerobaculia bacterium]
MEINFLSSESFRNLAPSRLEFHPRLNLVVGSNGQGKTNLLEAIALVSGRASFRTNELENVRLKGSASTVLSARVRTTHDGENEPTETTLGLFLREGAREHYRDGKKISRLAASRLLPAVFLSAADLTRFGGPPSERRRALDRAALLLNGEHASHIQRYEKARASKSRLLSLKNRFDADELAVYEGTMIEFGGLIAAERRRAAARLEPELSRNARALASPFEDLRLELRSDLAGETAEELSASLRTLLHTRKSEERRAGRCLVGPHRDDLILTSQSSPVVEQASSGENRTLLLAWTLAEMTLVREALGKTPILAFDDFDSEWDPQVLTFFADALPEDGQLFLTSARPEAVRGLPFPSGGIYRMQAGRLAREGILGAGRTRESVYARSTP